MRIADVRSLMPHQVIMFQAGKRAMAVGRPVDEVSEAMRTETAAAADGASPAVRAAMVADAEQVIELLEAQAAVVLS